MKTITYKTIGLEMMVADAIENIKKYANDNNFIIEGNIDKLLANGIVTPSNNARKNVIRKIMAMEKKGTIKSINAFLNYFSKAISGSFNRVRIHESRWEYEILTAKFILNKNKKEYEAALASYKDIKGSFFKDKFNSQSPNKTAFM